MLGRFAVLCLLAVKLLPAAEGTITAASQNPFSNVTWDQACEDFVSGSLTAFFDGELKADELKCVSKEISEIVKDFVEAFQDLIETIMEAIEGPQPSGGGQAVATTTKPSGEPATGAIATSTEAFVSGPTSEEEGGAATEPATEAPKTEAATATEQPSTEGYEATRRLAQTFSPYGEAGAVAEEPSTSPAAGQSDTSDEGTPLGLSLAMEVPRLLGALSKITTLYKKLTGECVESDMTDALELAKKNLKNSKHVGQQIFINGANLTMDLNNAIEEFRKQKFSDVGFNIGTILRKVLLETSKEPAQAPPKKEEIVELTAGLLDGIAGGFAFQVKESGSSSTLTLDFGECLAFNTKTFALLWYDIADLVAAVGADMDGKKKEKEEAEEEKKGGTIEDWQVLISDLLVKLPAMMGACGLTADTMSMLADGSRAVHRTFDLTLPAERATWDDIQETLDKAVKKFEEREWDDFGKLLGEVVKSFILIWIPDKYYKGTSGELRRWTVVRRRNLGNMAMPVLLVTMVSFLLAGAFAFTFRKRLSGRTLHWDEIDMEAVDADGAEGYE